MKVTFVKKLGEFRNTYHVQFEKIGSRVFDISVHLGGDYTKVEREKCTAEQWSSLMKCFMKQVHKFDGKAYITEAETAR